MSNVGDFQSCFQLDQNFQSNYLESQTKVHPCRHEVPTVLTVRFVEEDEGVFIRGKYDVFHGGGDNIQHQLSGVIRSRLGPHISANKIIFVLVKIYLVNYLFQLTLQKLNL